MTIDTNVGYIAHLRLNNILKGTQGVYFELVECDLEAGRQAAHTLRQLVDLDLTNDFTVAAPTCPPVVEPAKGGDSEPAPLSPPTLDQQRHRYKTLSDGDQQAVAAYWDRNSTDLTDPTAIAESIDAVTNFRDIQTTPTTPPTTPPTEPSVLPSHPDEGDPAPDGPVDKLEALYRKLGDDERNWVNTVATQAHRAGYPITMSPNTGIRSLRRYRIMHSLIQLADNGFGTVDAVRGIAANIHPDIADNPRHNLGQIIGSLNAEQAALYDEIVGALIAGNASMRFTPHARVEVVR